MSSWAWEVVRVGGHACFCFQVCGLVRVFSNNYPTDPTCCHSSSNHWTSSYLKHRLILSICFFAQGSCILKLQFPVFTPPFREGRFQVSYPILRMRLEHFDEKEFLRCTLQIRYSIIDISLSCPLIWSFGSDCRWLTNHAHQKRITLDSSRKTLEDPVRTLAKVPCPFPQVANGYARLWLHESEVFDAMKAAFLGGIGAEETCIFRGAMLCIGPVLSAFRFIEVSYVWSPHG